MGRGDKFVIACLIGAFVCMVVNVVLLALMLCK